MRRNSAEPCDAGVLHLDGWVEALGDGVADERGALLLQQLDLPLLLRDQPVDPRRLAIQKRRDGALLVDGRNGE